MESHQPCHLIFISIIILKQNVNSLNKTSVIKGSHTDLRVCSVKGTQFICFTFITKPYSESLILSLNKHKKIENKTKN